MKSLATSILAKWNISLQWVFWHCFLLNKFLNIITLWYLWAGNMIFTGLLPPCSCCVYVVDNYSNVWNKSLMNLCSQLNARSFNYFFLTPPNSLWEACDGQISVWMAVEKVSKITRWKLTSVTHFAGKIRIPVKKLWLIVDIYFWSFSEVRISYYWSWIRKIKLVLCMLLQYPD